MYFFSIYSLTKVEFSESLERWKGAIGQFPLKSKLLWLLLNQGVFSQMSQFTAVFVVVFIQIGENNT